MKRRFILAFAIACLVLGTVAPASAGGWAMAKLLSPRGPIVAGQEVAVDIQILQHGIPGHFVTNGGPLTIRATNRTTGKAIESTATSIGDGTTYRAIMTFNEPGEYKWTTTLNPFPMSSNLPGLIVLAPGEASTPALQPVRQGEAVTIGISDVGFTLPAAPIPAGTTIEWVNNGSLPHEVMADDLAFADVPILQPGESYRTTIATAGTYTIFCPPHTGMIGTLLITDAAAS
jgi:plastocyanin